MRDDLLCARQLRRGCYFIIAKLRDLRRNIAGQLPASIRATGGDCANVEECCYLVAIFFDLVSAARYSGSLATAADTALRYVSDQLYNTSLVLQKAEGDYYNLAYISICDCINALDHLRSVAEDAVSGDHDSTQGSIEMGMHEQDATAGESHGAAPISCSGNSHSSPDECEFRILQLTDLHIGAPNQAAEWDHIKDQFLTDLRWLQDRLGGPWHAVLFSGDAVFSGTQFADFKNVLDELRDHWSAQGQVPPIFAVPGNHDLKRPERTRAEVKQLRDWVKDEDVRKQSLEQSSPYHVVIRDAFEHYTSWWDAEQEYLSQDLDLKAGIMPGDFSATLRNGKFSVGLVGLNSSFLQLGTDNYEEKLVMDVEQLRAVCGNNMPTWTRERTLCMLLTHHPMQWMHKQVQSTFEQEVFPGGRFGLHISGHLHESGVRIMQKGTQPGVCEFTSSSLFGRKEYRRKKGRPNERVHGYTAIKLMISGGKASLRFWPRRAIRSRGWALADDVYSVEFDRKCDDHGSNPVDISACLKQRD